MVITQAAQIHKLYSLATNQNPRFGFVSPLELQSSAVPTHTLPVIIIFFLWNHPLHTLFNLVLLGSLQKMLKSCGTKNYDNPRCPRSSVWMVHQYRHGLCNRDAHQLGVYMATKKWRYFVCVLLLNPFYCHNIARRCNYLFNLNCAHQEHNAAKSNSYVWIRLRSMSCERQTFNPLTQVLMALVADAGFVRRPIGDSMWAWVRFFVCIYLSASYNKLGERKCNVCLREMFGFRWRRTTNKNKKKLWVWPTREIHEKNIHDRQIVRVIEQPNYTARKIGRMGGLDLKKVAIIDPVY